MTYRVAAILAFAALIGAAACTAKQEPPVRRTRSGVPLLAGLLVPAKTTMVTAWDVPLNPLEDKSLDNSPLAKQIQRGFRIFTNTRAEAPRLTGGTISCSNCHLNAGQRERALPLVGVAAMFPEYNGRSARLFSLTDRVVDCFLRSENAPGVVLDPADLPKPTDPEVLALSAYITWLARGNEMGKSPEWRGKNAIAAANRIPIDKLDPDKGEAIFKARCVTCHAADGQGVMIGDKRAGPLWGPNSWNDGAGAGRIYTLAGMIRYSMPYLDPGNMTDADAQNLAAFIDSKPRPVYPYKDRDYLTSKVPVDAVYYLKPQNTAAPNALGTH